MNRRDLFKFLAGIGLGAVVIETYERLYHIPMVEIMFRKELEYWINQYNTAKEEVERLTEQLRKREGEISSLRSDLTKSKEELEHLIQQYNTTKEEANRLSEMLKQSEEEINNLKEKTSYWETQYNTTREEVDRLNSTINKLDELERESTSAIEYYRGRMDEAIRKLKEIIERYRVLLGDERVSFEYSTLKILEDLRLTEERLQKVLPYFPLILNLYWRPMRVVNDKIYDINVVFEVISPLSSLEDVEVTLRPIEYKYFITKYGMREEDYNKVFPEEDVRIVRIKPLQIERVIFSVDFKDLKGGREYAIEVRVRDAAGNEGRAEIKTPYIRQFENIAKTDDITVAAFYYNWYTTGYDIPKDLPDKPLLGLYYSDDNIVFNKHVDWATGHGINVFIFPYPYPQPTKAFDWLERTFRKNMEADLFNQIKFSFCSTFVDNTAPQPPYNFDDPKVKEEFINNINYIKEHYANLSNFWKIDGKPVIVLWGSHGYKSTSGNIEEVLKEARKNFYIISHIPVVWNEADVQELIKNSDAIYDYEPLPLWLHRDMNLEEAVPYTIERTKIWIEIVGKYGKPYIPTISPGFDNTHDYRPHPTVPIIYRSENGFRLYIYEVKKLPNPLKIIFLTSFNELFEGTFVEPTQSDGMNYLKILKNLNTINY
jgi:plasmid maintenance system antidote protein VapI